MICEVDLCKARAASVLLLLSLAGCASFSGTRYDYPWAQEYNYLKGQRVEPEEIGIHIASAGPYSVVTTAEEILGEETVSLPLSMRGGAITTSVRLNGQRQVPAVLDTGAPFNLVSLTLAYNLDLPVTRPKTLPQQIAGFGGASTDCGWSRLESLQLGKVTYTNALVSIPLEKFDQVSLFGFLTLNRDEFVILGLNDMARTSYMTFDFPRGRLTLARQTPYQPASGHTAMVVPLQINRGPTLTTDIVVDGKGPFPCRIDTGKTFNAPALTVPQKIAEELGYWKGDGGRKKEQVGIGGSFESHRFRLKRVEIGGHAFPGFTADTHEGAGEFILGASFLRAYRVTIDFRGKQMYLEK